MCGICGIKGLSLEAQNNSRALDMLEVLQHRGPDESGVYSDAHIWLGMRRLRIIDLETGSQPIYNEDKNLVLICNGEIYNFRPLRENLIKKGHLFQTKSDVEVLIHLYEEHGVECLEHVKGMFSFALWDKNKEVLFVARDRLGIKPLYYYHKNGIFAFASEAKALLKLPFVGKELNIQALSLYFSLEYIPSPHSIFKDIHKLEPGRYMLYKNGSLEITRYWDLADKSSGNRLSFSDAQDKFLEGLRTSIREHLISDVPWGIFLSGGIDSSALVALARKFSNSDISTFNIGFEEDSFDESAYALLVSKYFATQHHSYTFTVDDFISNFDEVANSLDEPFADLSIFPTAMLAKFSRQQVKVCLSGEGADELFMGYPTHLAHRYMGMFNTLPHSLKLGMEYLANSLPTSYKYFSLDFKLKQFMRGIYEADSILRHILWMGAFSETEKTMLFSKNLSAQLGNGKNTVGSFLSGRMSRSGFFSEQKQIQYLDIFTYLCEDLLVKLDRASMHSSLEARVPYLDHHLVEFIWGLDSKYISGKRLLKKIMQDSLPNRVLRRRKKGFPIPFSLWLNNRKFRKTIDRYFHKDYISKQGLFNYDYLKSLFDKHLSGKMDNRKKIGAYVMFQAWYQRWQS